jgi:uncharacterized protein (DUF736 family)
MVRDQTKIPIGYLWIKKDKQGREYLAGPLSVGLFGEVPIVVFKEEHKANERAPDYIIRLATEAKD